MTTKFDSFNQSKLGEFTESKLHDRNGEEFIAGFWTGMFNGNTDVSLDTPFGTCSVSNVSVAGPVGSLYEYDSVSTPFITCAGGSTGTFTVHFVGGVLSSFASLTLDAFVDGVFQLNGYTWAPADGIPFTIEIP